MSRLCYGLVIVLLCCGGQQSRASDCQCKCPPTRVLCVDLQKLNILVRNISLERDTSHNTLALDGTHARYLLAQTLFDKIREDPQLHGCVLTRILDFYQSLFKHRLGAAAKHDNLTHLLHSIKKQCIRRKKKVCDALQSASVNESFTGNLSDFSARKLSLLQIQTLDTATQQLKDTGVQNKALSELENLQAFIEGPGFRRFERKLTPRKHH